MTSSNAPSPIDAARITTIALATPGGNRRADRRRQRARRDSRRQPHSSTGAVALGASAATAGPRARLRFNLTPRSQERAFARRQDKAAPRPHRTKRRRNRTTTAGGVP